MSNAENVQWDYKDSCITIADRFQCNERENFSVVSVFFSVVGLFNVIFSVIFS